METVDDEDNDLHFAMSLCFVVGRWMIVGIAYVGGNAVHVCRRQKDANVIRPT